MNGRLFLILTTGLVFSTSLEGSKQDEKEKKPGDSPSKSDLFFLKRPVLLLVTMSCNNCEETTEAPTEEPPQYEVFSETPNDPLIGVTGNPNPGPAPYFDLGSTTSSPEEDADYVGNDGYAEIIIEAAGKNVSFGSEPQVASKNNFNYQSSHGQMIPLPYPPIYPPLSQPVIPANHPQQTNQGLAFTPINFQPIPTPYPTKFQSHLPPILEPTFPPENPPVVDVNKHHKIIRTRIPGNVNLKVNMSPLLWRLIGGSMRIRLNTPNSRRKALANAPMVPLPMVPFGRVYWVIQKRKSFRRKHRKNAIRRKVS